MVASWLHHGYYGPLAFGNALLHWLSDRQTTGMCVLCVHKRVRFSVCISCTYVYDSPSAVIPMVVYTTTSRVLLLIYYFL